MGRGALRHAAIGLRDALTTQVWPLPTLGVALAVVLGVALPQLDAVTVLPDGLTGYLFGGGADAARSVLGTIAGSLITVTALTFSLTVVTLQLASSQFSPRLLRTFTRDRVVHLTLALSSRRSPSRSSCCARSAVPPRAGRNSSRRCR